jgi:hypothetical protein
LTLLEWRPVACPNLNRFAKQSIRLPNGLMPPRGRFDRLASPVVWPNGFLCDALIPCKRAVRDPSAIQLICIFTRIVVARHEPVRAFSGEVARVRFHFCLLGAYQLRADSSTETRIDRGRELLGNHLAGGAPVSIFWSGSAGPKVTEISCVRSRFAVSSEPVGLMDQYLDFQEELTLALETTSNLTL